MGDSKSIGVVNFANLNHEFTMFHQKHKDLCQSISGMESKQDQDLRIDSKNIVEKLKHTKANIIEYFAYTSRDFQKKVKEDMNNLMEDLIEDSEYEKLRVTPKGARRTPGQNVIFYQKYYKYIIKLFSIIGFYGDEMTTTFMPRKSDRQKMLKYSNQGEFYGQFTRYKTSVSRELGKFNIYKCHKTIIYLLGFYFAYYLFIEPESRKLCEEVFSNILSIVTDNKILSVLATGKEHLTGPQRGVMRDLDLKLQDGLLAIFARMTYSYSEFGVMPKLDKKILIDKTTI